MARITLVAFMAALLLPGAEPARPKITGLAHIALYTKNPEMSREYYRNFLGFEEAYQLNASQGQPRAWIFKINDRQFVEIYPEQEPGSDRLHHIAIETEDARAMRDYLAFRGIAVPARVSADRLGNIGFRFRDPQGHLVQFVQFQPGSRAVRDTGKYLSNARISKRMMHVGIIVTRLEPELKFYMDVLGFREFWRGSSNGTQLSWINLRAPDGDDYIELMLYKTPPAPTARGSAHHLCLEVPSVPDSASELENRPYRRQYTRTIETRVGRNRRRQVNLFDPDGTRAELMEPRTIDGAPAESSKAPPPQ
jgi:lactoylglutathione lyase